MALTREELEARTRYLGSSDVPALLGVSPYANVTDLWLSKTGRVELTPTTNPAADLGDRLEPALVQIVADELGTPVEFNRRVHHPERAWMSAQLDGWMPDLARPIEAKTRGLFSPVWDGSDWGDGGDAVPFDVLAQVCFALLVTGADSGEVVALLGRGMGVRRYTIPRVPNLIEEIERRATAFWEDHVQAGVPPVDVPHLDTLRDLRREAGKSVEVDHEAPFQWENLTDQLRLVEGARDALKAGILHQMGDAERGVTPFGEFTYAADKRGRRTFRYKGAPS